MLQTVADISISSKPLFFLDVKKTSKKKVKKTDLKGKDRVLNLLLDPKYFGKGISFSGIAKKAGLKDRRYASVLVKKLEAEGMLRIEHTSYKHPRMPNAKCWGKNIYYPGPNAPKPREKISKTNVQNCMKNYDTNSTKNSSKEEFAKRSASFSFSRNGRIPKSKKKDLFEEFGLEKQFPYRPLWWFKDLTKLKKALKIIKRKVLEGFQVRDFVKFFSHLLAHGVFGYRKHCARNLSLAVVKPNLKRVEPMLSTEPITAGYEAILSLKKKYNLDMSFTNIERLLRKGFSHLAIASQAVLKRLEISKVRDINGFINFAVSMKEPYELLKTKTSTE